MLERLDQAYATCGWQGPDTWPAAGQGLGRAQGGAMHIEDPAEYGSTPEHVLTAASPRSDHHHCTWDEARGSGSSSSSLRPSATSPRRSPTGGLEIAHREHAAAPATVSNASTISGCHHQGGAAGASAAFCCSPSGRWGSQQGHSGGHQPPHPDTLYYRRQLLTLSVEGRRVDVITISDCWGATGGVEPPVPGVFEHDPGPPAAEFAGKKVREGRGRGGGGVVSEALHRCERDVARGEERCCGRLGEVRRLRMMCGGVRSHRHDAEQQVEAVGSGMAGDIPCGQLRTGIFRHRNYWRF